MHHVLNVAVLGESQVGKTSILSQFCQNNDLIVEVKFGAKKQIPYRIQFWDGNYPDDGQMDGMILVYDGTNFNSFEEVSRFLKEHRAVDQNSKTLSMLSMTKNFSGIFKVEPQIKSSLEKSTFDLTHHQSTQCLVIGNKYDKEDTVRQVHHHHFENLKDRYKDIAFFRTSVLTEGDSVKAIIDDFIRSKVISTSIIQRVANGTYMNVINSEESDNSSIGSQDTIVNKITRRVIRVTYV